MFRKRFVSWFCLWASTKIQSASSTFCNLRYLFSYVWSWVQTFWIHDHSDCNLLFIFEVRTSALARLLHFSWLWNNASSHLLFILFLDLVIHECSLIILLYLSNIFLKSYKYFLMVGRHWFKVDESMNHVWIGWVCNIDWEVSAIKLLGHLYTLLEIVCGWLRLFANPLDTWRWVR